VYPTNVGSKGKKPKNVAPKKEKLFSKFNEEKGNGMKCKFFEVDTLVSIQGNMDAIFFKSAKK
jgi:hypothetical protein